LKILVTGPNGYIGGSVAAALIADGHEVAASFAARKRPMQLRLIGSSLSSAHWTMRICCKPRLGLPMLSSMRPRAITEVPSKH
jgi:hypothetical protein